MTRAEWDYTNQRRKGGGFRWTCVLCGGRHPSSKCKATPEKRRRHENAVEAAHKRADEDDFDANISLRRPPWNQRLKEGFRLLRKADYEDGEAE